MGSEDPPEPADDRGGARRGRDWEVRVYPAAATPLQDARVKRSHTRKKCGGGHYPSHLGSGGGHYPSHF